MKNVLAATAIIVAAFAFAPAAHAADLKIKVNPSAPIVDESITVSWTVTKPLKPGWHYEAMVLGNTGYACNGMVVKTSKRNPGKGKRMSMSFYSTDGFDGKPDGFGGEYEWCQGGATVTVSKARNVAKLGGGSIIDIASFRFYAMP